MPLFILRPTTRFARGYDMAQGFVVRAENESTARRLAAEAGGDEQPTDEDSYYPLPNTGWLNPACASCELLLPDGETDVIIRDFNAG